MKPTAFYTLAWSTGRSVEVQPTGYGDLLTAIRDAEMWASATGRSVAVRDAAGQVTGFGVDVAA